jgi:transglutaminase-like putative cysteine protease/tetratricopeptide (TPR) repeat protein
LGLVVFMVAANAATSRVKSGQYEISLSKTPEWVLGSTVQPASLSKHQTSDTDKSKFLFEDIQINYRSGNNSTFIRNIVLIRDQETLKQLGEINFSFSSVFNKSSLHHVDIYRQGSKLNRLDAAALKLAREEKGWDQRVLTGYVKVFMPVRDLRIGDVLDFAYSIDGDNPILGKKIRLNLAQSGALHKDKYRSRVLTDVNRPLQFKTFLNAVPPKESRTSAGVEYLTEISQVAPYELEARAPFWDYPESFVQYSEYANWAEVVDWGLKLFAQEDRNPGEVLELARKFKSSSQLPEEQVANALHFVQEEIRYLSESIGTNAYLPHVPSEVFRKRYGDCKDKAYLLVTLVRAMGYEAYPVLVSTSQRQKLPERLPGSQVFDHAIVLVVIDGESFWLDATMTFQPVSLTKGSMGLYEHGLVLKPGTSDLTVVDARFHERNRIDTVFRYRFDNLSKPARLEATLRAVGWFAVDARAASNQGRFDQFMETLLATHVRFQPGFSVVEKPSMAIDAHKGEVTIRYTADIKGGFSGEPDKLPVLALMPGLILDMLTMNVAPNRRLAFVVGMPTTVTHRDILEANENLGNTRQQVNDQTGDGLIDFSREISVGERGAEFFQKLVLKRDYLLPSDIASSVQTRAKIREKLMFGFRPVSKELQEFSIQQSTAMRRDFGRMSERDFSAFVARRYKNDIEFQRRKMAAYDLDGASRRRHLQDIAFNYSLMGDKKTALSVIEDALRQDGPSDAQLQSAKGQFLFGQSKFLEARDQLSRAHAAGSSDAETLRFLGMTDYYLGNFKSALDNFEKRFRAQAGEESKWFALINMKMAAMRAGLDFAGYERNYLPEMSNSAELPKAIYRHLKGEIGEQELLRAGRSDSKLTEWRNRSEIYYYMAQKARHDGDVAKTKELLEKVQQMNVVDYIETLSSQFELAELNR